MANGTGFIVAALAPLLIAAIDGGPSSTGPFFIGVFAILGVLLLLRKFYPAIGGTRRNRQARRSIDTSATPREAVPLQSADELQARLNRIREQAVGAPSLAQPMAPPAGLDPNTTPAQNDAILFHQHFPPRGDALSYWGDVPLVPPGFIWPSFTTPDGEERALHHVLQVDCAAIPDAARFGLPSDGLLAIFIDLEWGTHWCWRVIHSPGDPRTFAPAAIPATLPNAYGERAMWQWVRRDEDWPRLLPRWSFDPVVVRGGGRHPPADDDDAEERKFWPGDIDLGGELAKIDGAIAESHYFQNSYGEDRRLNRPYANFPHDWQAVRIAMGELAYQAKRQHLDRFVQRGDMTQEEHDAYRARMHAAIDDWTVRANAADRLTPLTAAESDAAWQVFLDTQHVSMFALSEAVSQSIEATLAANPDPASILPEAAMAMVRSRHALGSRSEHGLHLNTPDHLLGPPSYVQGDADERLHEWLLLFEMSSDDPIGHLFAEGVYQFWIRPEDLAAHRFDRVDLEGSAY